MLGRCCVVAAARGRLLLLLHFTLLLLPLLMLLLVLLRCWCCCCCFSCSVERFVAVRLAFRRISNLEPPMLYLGCCTYVGSARFVRSSKPHMQQSSAAVVCIPCCTLREAAGSDATSGTLVLLVSIMQTLVRGAAEKIDNQNPVLSKLYTTSTSFLRYSWKLTCLFHRYDPLPSLFTCCPFHPITP